MLMRRSVLFDQRTFYPERTYPYIMPAERSIDVDEPFDLLVAHLLLEARARGAVHPS
jgi:CMP-N-acetylneuraminic acid synthetase